MLDEGSNKKMGINIEVSIFASQVKLPVNIQMFSMGQFGYRKTLITYVPKSKLIKRCFSTQIKYTGTN